MKRMKNKRVHSLLVAGALAASVVCGSIGGALITNVENPTFAHAAAGINNKTTEANAHVYYVGTQLENSDAGTRGTTPKNPMSVTEFFRGSALYNSLVPGDIVRFMPGEHYYEPVVSYEENPVTGEMDYYTTGGNVTIDKNGTYDDYIIFESYQPEQNSEKATLNFKKQSFASTNRGVEIKGSYIYWRNIDVCGAGDNGLYIGGSYNIVENCEFYNNRDTGLQLGRSFSDYTSINSWPSYNLIKNCTSYNNYDNETYGENADGFAAKLTVGYGNIFDGCIAYRNSDDGWDLYAKADTGNIGAVIIYNCVAFDNGFLQKTQQECNDWYTFTDASGHEISSYHKIYDEPNTNKYDTRDGDGNGFKLGGGTMEGDVILNNCLAFNNRMHGVTDNSNPGVLSINNVTSYNNGVAVDNRKYGTVKDGNGATTFKTSATHTEDYYDIVADGTVIDASGNKIILDESGVFNADLYFSLDDEDYILNKADVRISDGNDGYLKGRYVTGKKEDSTLNANHGKIVITGKIKDSESVCNNIDIERTAASYNNFTNIVSVIDGSELTGSDRYKGSGEYSFLSKSGSKSTKIGSSMDTDYLAGKTGTEVDAPAPSALFERVVGNDLAFQKLTGREDPLHYIHKTFREDDGTINLGDLFKIKDYTLLFGNEKKIGADLAKTNYDEYTHYEYTYLTDGTATNLNEATVVAVKNMLYLPTNAKACYQDFQAPTVILGCTVEWSSSDESIVEVTDDFYTSLSGTRTVNIIVYRQEQERNVTLTATITGSNGATETKQFPITVKTITYEIGNVVAEDVENDKVILDQYSVYTLPEINVTNASDINGKYLKKGTYEESTKVYYSALKGAHQIEVNAFSPSHPGVFEIVTTVKIGNISKSYSYNIFVVSGSAQVDFLKDSEGLPMTSLGVDHSGYHIEGSLNNVSGTLYALVTRDAAAQPDASEIITKGVPYKITSDEVYAAFEEDNSSPYQVHYVICNSNGEASSDVYRFGVVFEQISSKAQFNALANSGGDSSKIYQLTCDLDFTGDEWTIGGNKFVGYFDGQGHTIKGISATDTKNNGRAAIFFQLYGGTIVNVNFDKISLSGAQNVGVIGSAYSGYVGNVKITDISVTGDQRIGGLIGRAYEQVGAPLIIDRVSVVNTDTTLKISGTGGSARAAGIIGFMQNNANYVSDFIDIRISNCLVDAVIGTLNTKENGGIFGVFDDAYNPKLKHSLTISNSVFLGSCYAESRCGGILAYQKGIDSVTITNCVNFGTLYHAGLSKPVETAQKNCSGIFGGYSTNATTTVRNCFAKFFEHNQSYNVEVIDETRVSAPEFWTNYVHLDSSIWEVVTEGGKAVKPYVRLK